MGNQLVIMNQSSHEVIIKTAKIAITPDKVFHHAKGEIASGDNVNSASYAEQAKYLTRVYPGLYATLPMETDDVYLVLAIDQLGSTTRIIYSDWPNLKAGHLEITDSKKSTIPISVTPIQLTEQQLVNYQNTSQAFTRGVTHLKLGKLDMAIADWTASIEVEPNVPALTARGLAFYQNEQIDKALEDWNRSIALCPDYDTLVNRGNHWLSNDDLDDAIKDYTTAIELKTDDPSAAYCNRAAAHLGLDEWDDAIKDCETALSFNPILAQAWHNRATAYAGKESADKAYSDHNISAIIEPDNDIYQKARDEAKKSVSEAGLRQAEKDAEELYAKHPHVRPVLSARLSARNHYKGAKGERGEFKGISPELYQQLKKMELTDEEIVALADDNIVLTPEEISDLSSYFPHLNNKFDELTADMKLRLAMYRQRVKKYPVLKRWKPLLAACIDSSTWAIQSQFGPISARVPVEKDSKWKVDAAPRTKI